MDHQVPEDVVAAPEPADPVAEAAPPADDTAPLRTGDPRVDQVLASVEPLDGLPVDEHVAVFERAHDGLRDALDARLED
ncbi:MAG: hypothetical protein R2734_01815 [Nocardioides sp.]